MSGICGVYYYNSEDKVSSQLLIKMADSICHRGTHSRGIYINHKIGLAARCTAQAAQQPSHNVKKNIRAVIDGQIFNKQELCNFIEKRGSPVSINSDSQMLTYIYELLGEEFIKMVDGEFAFCIWDSANNKLILGRNHSGNRPLYYYDGKDRIIFGSEIKSILTNVNVKREIDPRALDIYFSFSYVPTPDTLFKDIKQVPAGALLICQDKKIRICSFWILSSMRKCNA